MIEIVYYAASSLDGYIATNDGGVDWLTPFQEGGEDYGFPEFMASVDALLMGSSTYEAAIEFGKWASPDIPSWVFTSRGLDVVHPTITLTAEDPADVVGRLEEDGINRAWLMGGGKLATSFRERGLITEYQIGMMPVVLGDGIPLFAPVSHSSSLRLIGCTEYSGGVVMLNYQDS